MTATTATTWIGPYSVRYDADGYRPWGVYDPEGEKVDWTDDREQAVRWAEDLWSEHQAEDRAERLAALQDRLAALVDGCDDLDKLTRALAIMEG